MTETPDDAYPADWLTTPQREVVDQARGLDSQLDGLSDDQLLDVLNRQLAKRKKD